MKNFNIVSLLHIPVPVYETTEWEGDCRNTPRKFNIEMDEVTVKTPLTLPLFIIIVQHSPHSMGQSRPLSALP